MPGALACLRLELLSLCDFLSPCAGTLLDLSDWASFVCRLRSFTVLHKKVAFFSNPINVGWFSLPA